MCGQFIHRFCQSARSARYIHSLKGDHFSLKKIFTAIVWIIILALPAFAADEIFPITVTAADGRKFETTALYKAGDLWLSEDGVRFAGVELTSALNGKGFDIAVREPDKVFEIPALRELAGNVLTLYFPAYMSEAKVKYINISGLEPLTGCLVEGSCEKPAVSVIPKETVAFAGKNTNPVPKPFTLVWEHVTSYNPELAKQPVIEGLDVISPTWFNLSEATGSLANRASCAYVTEAHKRGLRVWAMVTNSFNKQMTKAFLANSAARRLFIARLLAYARLYGIDGINVDFENVDVTDRFAFVQLLRELAPKLQRQQLVFSVDVNKPGNTNSARSHDRRSIAAVADYVMVMTYDQHWRACPVAGSVADLAWTKSTLIKTLEEVPAEKLLLGIPFYSRRWYCTKAANGKEKVSSKTLTMAQSDELIRKHSITPVWLADKGQDYYEYTEGGQKVKVWAENAKSIALRGKLAKEYNLAGAACWRKGQEEPYAWQALFNSMR